MAKHTDLSSLFKDVADAIRSKTGKTDKIVADDFPEVIGSISTGHPNGTKWTKSNFSSSEFIEEVYYFSNKWIVQTTTKLYYSTDLQTWNEVNFNPTEYLIKYRELLLAPSYENERYTMYYSSDGVSWHQSNLSIFDPMSIHTIDDVATVIAGGATYNSMDGKHWNKVGDFIYSYGATSAAGIHFRCSDSIMQYTTDGGVAWESCDISEPVYEISSIAYGKGKLVTRLKTTDTYPYTYSYYYSTDYKTWKKSHLTEISTSLYKPTAPAYNKGIFYACIPSKTDGAITTIVYSLDGVTWNEANSTFGDIVHLQYGNGVWVLLANESNEDGGYAGLTHAYYSYDCITFTRFASANHSIRGCKLECIDGVWFLSSFSDHIMCSLDGTIWTETSLPSRNESAAYHKNNMWIFNPQKTDGQLYYSTDGINWYTCEGLPVLWETSYVCHGGGVWFLIQNHSVGQGLYYSVGWKPPSTNQ